MNVHLTVQVPRSPDLNQTIDRFHQKLEPLLMAFQPELVQLQGRLLRHTSREGVICHLNLHLPTAQLASEGAAATSQAAFRVAADELVRQLNKHKQRLRETRPHWRLQRSSPRPLAPAVADGAATAHDLTAYFGDHYEQLLSFASRQVQLRERLGEVPRGSLDPSEVLDEVVVSALEAPAAASGYNRGRWLLMLTAAAIQRLAKTYGGRQHGLEVQSLPGDPAANDEPSPEELASTAEMMDQLAAVLQKLPASQRHDLVLYLLEGFRPEELAQISHRSRAEVESSLQKAEIALRAQPQLPSRLRQRLHLGLLPQSA